MIPAYVVDSITGEKPKPTEPDSFINDGVSACLLLWRGHDLYFCYTDILKKTAWNKTQSGSVLIRHIEM